uniref:Uncharacterized protein n=1 Tax=Arundo donax TaxID=35708 RepID=A0A0A9DS78_ARUDO
MSARAARKRELLPTVASARTPGRMSPARRWHAPAWIHHVPALICGAPKWIRRAPARIWCTSSTTAILESAARSIVFLAAPERPKTPTTTGPTTSGGFVFASPEKQPPTPTGTTTSARLSFLASSKQPRTPTSSTASIGFFAPLTYEPSLTPTSSAATAASLLSPKPVRTGSTDSAAFAFPSSAPVCVRTGSLASTAAKETAPPTGHVTPAFVFSASRSSPLLRKSGDGGKKRPRPLLRIDATPRVRNLRNWEEEPPQ